MLTTIPRQHLEKRAQQHGHEFLSDLQPAIVRQTTETITFDMAHAAWKAWEAKYAKPIPQPSPTEPLAAPKPVPFERWPAWAKALAERRQCGEVGPGDTMKRILGEPGNWYEKMREKIGFPCRCAERREEWNRRYPYSILQDAACEFMPD